MSEARLDSGMRVTEAVQRASAWWDARGRHLIKLRVDYSLGDVPSGILNGEPWDLLLKREKLRVVKVWHYLNVVRPDMLGIYAEAPFALGRERVH